MFPLSVLALSVALAACGKDAATASGAGGVRQARVAIQLAASSTSSSANPFTGILASDNGGPGQEGDWRDGMGHHWHGWAGWMRVKDVDSLIVTVTKLEVLTALADSEDAADSAADSTAADSARGHDDDDHDDFEEREFGWTQLAIVGDGHLDLIHLPDSTQAGLMFATGTLPAGRYRHVRIFVTNPQIFFDSLVVTPAGDTLQPHTAYPVVFPSADSTGAAIKTDDPFVVPAAGDTVRLAFDRDDTIRHIVITGDGKIIVPPVIR